MDDVHTQSILVIGPPHVGKSRVCNSLSEKTNMPAITLASSRDKYYNELNYDKEYANKLKREQGELARYEYSKPFEAYHVLKFLPTIDKPSIIKFEATQTVYEDQESFKQVYNEIKQFKNIILLLPDIDMLGSWQTINNLSKAPSSSDLSKLNWHLISSNCNTNLATHIVYCCGRSVDLIADEILEYVNSKTMEMQSVKVA